MLKKRSLKAKILKKATDSSTTSSNSPTVKVCVAMSCGAKMLDRMLSKPSTIMVRFRRLFANAFPPCSPFFSFSSRYTGMKAAPSKPPATRSNTTLGMLFAT